MARTTKKKDAVKETAVVTRAEKKDATKNLIREILALHPQKHNELIDEVAKLYTERYGDETDNVNDVKGRVGSVLDIMKKESDVMYDGGMYALKARMMPAPVEELPVIAEEKPAQTESEEAPAPKKRGRKTKAKTEEADEGKKVEPLPPAPLQPIAPVAPITPEAAPEPLPEETPAPKKRGRKPKAKAEEVLPEEKPIDPAMTEKKEEEPRKTDEAPMVEMKAEVPAAEAPTEEKSEEPKQLVVKQKAELAKPVMDMSFLFGSVKPAKETQEKPAPKSEEQTEAKPASKVEQASEVKTGNPPVQQEKKAEAKPVKAEERKPVKEQSKPAEKISKETPKVTTNVRKLPQGATVRGGAKTPAKPLTADEKLRENFLKRLRSLGGDYFEYYSVYLLERYSMKNGRRLEGMRVSGGDHDGGIDGEIELTDKLGFKETIYIQSKNWNPEKGDERLWIVGETLLQQFIGACACRQAKDGKQNCRGIFITTSRFTPEAKRILDTMSDKIVGYDGNDVFEAAKECAFGLVQKNGQWTLDERLLSGPKAFFSL